MNTTQAASCFSKIMLLLTRPSLRATFFMDESITDLGWPPKSSDLNVIENAWGEFTRRLHARGRQLDTTEDLREALLYEWEKLDIDYIRKLIRSFPRRLVECFNARGGHTRY